MTAMPLPATAMSVGIYIELPDELIDLPKNLERKLPKTMRRIALEGKSFWKSEAGRKLKSSRMEYQKSIDMQIVDNTSCYLVLQGFLAVSVEHGRKGFDMKPGFLAKAKPISGKRKFPRAVADTLQKTSGGATRYRVIPLNVNRYINMQKPKVFRTVTDKSPAGSWLHPGFQGVNLVETVIEELNTNIIPKNVHDLLGEL